MKVLQRFGVAIVATAALVTGACAPVRVNASLERGMDFTKYKSYAWATGQDFQTGDPRLDNNEFFQDRIRRSGDTALSEHGFEKVSANRADLVVHYHASVKQTIDVNELDRRYGYCQECRSSVYDAGTITLDLVDAHTKKLVWRGWSEGSLDGIDNQKLIEERVDDAVRRILQKLPPRS